MALDSIVKKDPNHRPVSTDELDKVLKQKSSKAKLISDLKTKRTKIIRFSQRSSSDKIKILKPPKRYKWKPLVFILAMLLIFVTLCLCVSETYPYRILSLVYQMKNETYLIGFQNSAELRPTGGFWGSFALLRVDNNISKSSLLFETNPYKNDNPLLKTTDVELPGPMRQIFKNRPQSFVNANWPFDFEQSAKTLQWYFGQGWQMQANGVIAVSSLSMIDLLRLTGPIEINGEMLNSDNFTRFMSEKIDTEYWLKEENIKTNEPKTIIKELFPKILDKLKNVSKVKLISFAIQQGQKGRILMYFNDEKKQDLAQKLNLSGKVIESPLDYLSVNNANLNGGKSSLNVSQSIKYAVDENNIVNLELTRSCKNPSWPDILNQNYTRVIAPLGSTFQSASFDGRDISSEVETNEESGKTTFGFWFSVGPGEVKTTKIQYHLPFGEKITPYNLTAQKQPGTLPDNLEVTFKGKQIYSGIFDKTSLSLP